MIQRRLVLLSLSLFQRFVHLKSLDIDSIDCPIACHDKDDPEQYVLQHTFDKLTKLELGHVPLQVGPGYTLAGCLPRLTHLYVIVYPELAQDVLNYDICSVSQLEGSVHEPRCTCTLDSASDRQAAKAANYSYQGH